MNRKSAIFIGMGFELVGAVMVCLYIGRWLDQNQGWGGLGAGVGAFIGLASWLTHLLVVVRQLAKEDKDSHTGAK